MVYNVSGLNSQVDDAIRKKLLSMNIGQLKRLYNSGQLPMARTKEGYYDLETSRKIEERIRRGY